MQGYLGKRMLLFVPTIFLVTTFVFLLLRIVPGDPAVMLLSGEEGLELYTDEDLARMRAKLGTDKPIVEQYARWVWGMTRLDFGNSIRYTTQSSWTSRPSSLSPWNSPSFRY